MAAQGSVGRVVTAGAMGLRPPRGCTGRRASTLFRSFEHLRAAPVNLVVGLTKESRVIYRGLPSLMVASVGACLPVGRPVTAADCQPSRTTLSREATAAGMDGQYHLVFVATEGEHKGRVARGRLELLSRDSAAAIRYTFSGKPHPHLREPYYGSAEVDLESLGAYTSGTLASRDPARPGVAVYEYHWDRAEAPTAIQLMVGAERTRRDIIGLDGPFVNIQVREFLPGGFRGTWEASLGITDYRAAGFFCATRES